jgi:hypothetical protein
MKLKLSTLEGLKDYDQNKANNSPYPITDMPSDIRSLRKTKSSTSSQCFIPVLINQTHMQKKVYIIEYLL